MTHLHDKIKRQVFELLIPWEDLCPKLNSAIFWQDSNAAWILGSERRFSYETCLAIDKNNEIVITDIWAGHFIPSHISSKLLDLFRRVQSNIPWESYMDMLLGCTIVGGTFAHLGVAGSDYMMLLH